MGDRLTISVAMATHNGAVFLGEQLESLARQRRLPDELVVSDDASHDDTLALLEAFAGMAPFPVSVYRNEVRAGATGNFERAFRKCTGDLIFLSDQDDRWRPDKVEALGTALERNHEAVLAFSDLELVDAAGSSLGETQWDRLGFRGRMRTDFGREPLDVLLRFNVVTGAALAFRASLLALLLPIPPEWVPDEWVALLAAATGRLEMVDAPLVDYRQHHSQEIGGSVSGWRAQLAFAKRHMDAAYMRTAARRSRIAAARLAKHADQLRTREVIDHLGARAAHYERRAGWRTRGLSRAPGVLREWAGRQYGAYDYGWKAAALDLLLPDRGPAEP